ncbi:ThiF family adenylyltransferase [Microaerobacter geothermalis]|uniref:ThiF family adenylyltransferase n=1 Tax=Microaerobacter geothermalis TaxID=674972 RepID=UPI001F30FA8B|nr:ThiF family adenylyltransferase [Microaerobacter geothermalis]MCF6092922.1 ThiF family adenylyltransferase [Microaerobacter geothermalis]
MNQQIRYSRQLLFPPIGREGQEKLANSRVTIVGMGALGSVHANHMVRSGVGYVRIIDRDFVEPSNLQRQILYDESDAKENLPKVIAAKKKLEAINSDVTIDAVLTDLNALNAEDLLKESDLVLDGTDNFQVRFLINDVCVKHGIPWVYGGAVSAKGMFAVIRPGITPCLRCLFHQPVESGHTETCDTVGVIAPVVSIIASFQAVEALKILVGDEEHINPNLEHYLVWENQHMQMSIKKARNPECPSCGKREFEFLDPAKETNQAVSLCGRNTVQILPSHQQKLNLDLLASKLKNIGKTEQNHFLLRFYIDDYNLVIFPDGRVLVQGTDDLTVARSLYAKYIGM